MLVRYRKYRFLFEELVKRDFTRKYKRTYLGMLWSMLAPLLQLIVMSLVFTQFFGRTTPYYTIYLFSGTLVFNFFNAATNAGMTALESNAGIFSKVNVPKYLFLLSRNVEAIVNFLLSLVIYFIFVAFNGLPFTWKFFLLLYPIVTLLLLNIGFGLILSAAHIFFKDIQYLYAIFVQLLMYMSAIFYTVDRYTPNARNAFLINPIFCVISYFRQVVIEGIVPSWQLHALCLGDALLFLLIGAFLYYKNNYKFLYYI
jgi:ABC-2 type transport system permease protein